MRHQSVQHLQPRAVSGEHLEVLGKEAAAAWCQGKYKDLSDAVIQTVKQASLSSEQVRRVIEFTNIAAFNREFQKEAAPHRVVSFSGGPADPSAIIKEINDHGAVTSYDRGLSDYHSPPPERTKVASPQAEAAFDELLARPSAPEYPMSNPLEAAIDTWDKLSAARDRLTTELDGLEVMFHDLKDRVFYEVKQAALNGASLGEIVQAWQTVSPGEEYIKVAFTYLTPRLIENGVFSSVAQMSHSLDKTASARVVNPRHPLVTEFGDFCEALSKLAETRATRDVVVEHIAPIQQFLKIAASGGLLPEAWRAYKGVLGDVGHHVGRAAEAVYNDPNAPGAIADKANKAFQFTGKYVVPAIAASKLKDRLDQSPTFQAVTNAILPNTPGTSQFYAGYGY